MRHFRPPACSRDPRYGKAREALLVIGAVAAEDSDYAKHQNGRGFSRADSTKGHGLARLTVASVLCNDGTYSEVIKLATRYRRQASRIAQGNLL